jgi:hypothetical protein
MTASCKQRTSKPSPAPSSATHTSKGAHTLVTPRAAAAWRDARSVGIDSRHSLNIAANYVTNHGADFSAMLKFVDIVPKTSLTSLDISANNLTNFGSRFEVLVKLVELLPSTKLTTLNLGGNHLYKKPLGSSTNKEGACVQDKLVEVLPTTSLTALGLADNRIRKFGAVKLCEAFIKTPTLQTVDLSRQMDLEKPGVMEELQAICPGVKFKPFPVYGQIGQGEVWGPGQNTGEGLGRR